MRIQFLRNSLCALPRLGRAFSPKRLHMLGTSVVMVFVLISWRLAIAPATDSLLRVREAWTLAQRERALVDKARQELARTQAAVRETLAELKRQSMAELSLKKEIVRRSESIAAQARIHLRAVEHQKDIAEGRERFVVVFEGDFEGVFHILRLLVESFRGMVIVETEINSGESADSHLVLKLLLETPSPRDRIFRCG